MKHKLKDLFRRTCATVLSVACFMSSASFLPIEKIIVMADDGFYFYFTQNISGERIQEDIAYILEGVPISIEDNLTSYSSSAGGSYLYNASNPFNLNFDLTSGATTPTEDQITQYLIRETKTSERDAYIQTLLGFTSGSYGNNAANIEFILNPVIQYSLSKNYQHLVRFGITATSYSSVDSSSMIPSTTPGSTSIDIYATINHTGNESIHLTTETNILTIEYIHDTPILNMERQETQLGDTGSTQVTNRYNNWADYAYATNTDGTKDLYWRVVDDAADELYSAEGYFKDYVLTDVSFSLNSVGGVALPSAEMNVGTFTLTNPNSTKQPITVQATFTDLGNIHEIYKGSKFTFNFSYETTENRLSFMVKNRQVAVEDIVDTIKKNVTAFETNAVPKYSTSSNVDLYLQNNHRPFIHATDYSFDTATGVATNNIVLSDIRAEDGFYLKTRHSDYNYTNGFYITWDWQPEGIVDLPAEPVEPKITDSKYEVNLTQGTDESLVDYNYRVSLAEAAAKLQFEADYIDFLADEADYWELYLANEELYDTVPIPDFNIVEQDDGTYKWTSNTSTYRDRGRMKVTPVERSDDVSGNLIATVHIFDDQDFKSAPSVTNQTDTTNANYDTSYYMDDPNYVDDGKGNGYNIPISSTSTVTIPITVTGTGVKPSFYITETIAATYSDDNKVYTQEGKRFEYGVDQITFPVYKLGENEFTGEQEIQEVNVGTKGSFNMDINDGVTGINTPPAEIPDGYSPPIPVAPHTAEVSINLGSGIEKTDSLIITNTTEGSSTASVSVVYHESSLQKHTFTFDEYGQTWEIPIEMGNFDQDDNEYICNFTFKATGEGLFNMKLDFYSEGGSEPRTTLTKAISIGSSLPSSDAKIDKIYLHLVQDVVDPKNLTTEEQRVADILDTLYSDKSTTNATDNPLRGEIPTDIIYNTDFTYDPSGYYYYEMELPYVISDVMLTPIYEGIAQGYAYRIEVTDPHTGTMYEVTGDGSPSGDFSATSGEIDTIDMRQSDLYTSPARWIEVKTLAADNKTSEKYYLKILRQDAESTVSLDELYVDTTDLLGEDVSLPLTNASGTVVQFVTDPVGVGARYYISLPYYYHSQEIPVNITAVSNGDWAKSPTITSDDGLVSKTGFFANIINSLSNKTTESFVLNYVDTYGAGSNAVGTRYPNKFTIRTYSESSDDYAEYYLTIYIEAPDTNDDLSSLQVLDPTIDDTVIPFKNGSFYPTKNDYIVEIPYELQKYRFSALPDSDNALGVRLVAPDGTILTTTTYATPGTPIQFLVDFATIGLSSTDLDFTFTIAVQSEDGIWSDQYNHPEGHSPYTILFQRDAPNSDSLLDSLDVLNFETATPVPEYVFEQVKKDYLFTVPYTTERIIIKPIANEQERTTITLNGVDFPDEDPGKDYYLTAGQVNTFTIIVTAEDPTYTTTYNLYITRANPDSEARLLNLVVNGADSTTPALFVPSTYEYDVTIPVGTETYTITPTAVSEYSVIIIDGVVIPSGTATSPYHAVDEGTVVKVYVSAQDGVSTQTYTLNITNHNLIEKSDDAVLLDVTIQGVDIEPKFLSNVYDYEVYTKIDTTLLSITPKVSPGATVTVSVGSKKLDEINGIYSTSFFTDTDAITISVTSESGNVSKDYKFAVYKNTEGKEGIFKPITDEDVDFNGANPIVVDISSYAVVDASVFNTMKDKYPDKTIVFTGNDYMIRIEGSQITENIPHTVQYDFGFSFTSPEEPLVQAILDASEVDEDAELEPIYLYFNGHGALPGQMVLTAVLGSSVGDSQLYWNYYNTERDRIDYYGYVQSNSKGTITVPLAHMSTYLVTTAQIGASEDRTNTGFGSLDLGNHSSGQSDGSIGTEGLGDDLTGGFGTGGSGTGTGSSGDISGDMNTNKPNPQTDIDGNPITNTGGAVYEQTTVYKWIEEKRDKRKKEEFVEC